MNSLGTRITLLVAKVICPDPYLCTLLLILRGRHPLGDEFTVPDTLAASFRWPLHRLRGARRRAIEAGWIIQLSRPKPAQPARYAFGARCWRDLPDAMPDMDISQPNISDREAMLS